MLSGVQARLDIAGGDDSGSCSAQRPCNVESNRSLILHQQDQSSGQRSVLHKIAPGQLLTETGQTRMPVEPITQLCRSTWALYSNSNPLPACANSLGKVEVPHIAEHSHRMPTVRQLTLEVAGNCKPPRYVQKIYCIAPTVCPSAYSCTRYEHARARRALDNRCWFASFATKAARRSPSQRMSRAETFRLSVHSPNGFS
jgi:hypothetical protein